MCAARVALAVSCGREGRVGFGLKLTSFTVFVQHIKWLSVVVSASEAAPQSRIPYNAGNEYFTFCFLVESLRKVYRNIIQC